MEPRLLQDLITIGGATTAAIVQSASNWLDLGNLEDLTLFLDVRDASGGSSTIYFDTSPSALEAQFVQLLPGITLAPGLKTSVVASSLAHVPPARFLRWRWVVGGSAAASVTFRIWVAGYGWA